MYLVDGLATVVDGLGVVRPLSLSGITWATTRSATASVPRGRGGARRRRRGLLVASVVLFERRDLAV